MNKDIQKGNSISPNYGHLSFKEKVFRNLRDRFVLAIFNTPFQFGIYCSYWHYKLNSNNIINTINQNIYLTQKPDYGAGIGHQMADWNTAYFFSNYFNLKFAHTPFSSEKWESFLGFGKDEILAKDLFNNNKFKKVRLPKFDSTIPSQVHTISEIINSYKRDNILFLFESNQGYMKQFESYKSLSQKFFNSNARTFDKLIFPKDSFNISIHIRKRMKIETDLQWSDRGLDDEYFVNILETVLKNLKEHQKIDIFLFSQGAIDDFKRFSHFPNLHYCLEMNPYDSFLHMVKADLLISCKSSFSYKPALISKGIKICPNSFWHSYPNSEDFILADNQGVFDTNKLITQLNLLK